MAPSDRAARRPGIPGNALAILYLIAATAPLLAAWAAGIEPENRWSELGAGLAMISGAMFFLQFWSSGRFETLSERVGIDRTMGFHRIAAAAGGIEERGRSNGSAFWLCEPHLQLGAVVLDQPAWAESMQSRGYSHFDGFRSPFFWRGASLCETWFGG